MNVMGCVTWIVEYDKRRLRRLADFLGVGRFAMATKRVVPIYRHPDKLKSRRIRRAILELKRRRMLEMQGKKPARVRTP